MSTPSREQIEADIARDPLAQLARWLADAEAARGQVHLQAEFLREVGAAVREHDDLVAHALVLGPGRAIDQSPISAAIRSLSSRLTSRFFMRSSISGRTTSA